jgi:hypothetical protein
LHGKIDEMHAYTVSLEAKLKELVPTCCSTCEVHALKNRELAHYVNHLQDENGELRKMMGWLSGHEPQLRMMMETYKRYDGQALGSEKVGECSGGGGEKIGDIQAPPKTFHKNAYAPKQNPLRNKLDTNQIYPYFLMPQMISNSPSSSRAIRGMCSLGNRVKSLVRRNRLRSQVEKNQVSSPIPTLNRSPCSFIVTIMGEMVTRVSFPSRRSVGREWLRSGQRRTSTTHLMVCMSLVCHSLGVRPLCALFQLRETRGLSEEGTLLDEINQSD